MHLFFFFTYLNAHEVASILISDLQRYKTDKCKIFNCLFPPVTEHCIMNLWLSASKKLGVLFDQSILVLNITLLVNLNITINCIIKYCLLFKLQKKKIFY